jgi:hypothetical protein
MDIYDADDLARWLATDPAPYEQDQALDDLIGWYGHDTAVQMWNRANRALPVGAEP